MNLLYVLTYFPKLSETFILNQIIRLTNLGHHIKILSYLSPDNLTTKEEIIDKKINKYHLLEKTSYLKDFYKKDKEYRLKNPDSILEIIPSLSKFVSKFDLLVSHFADSPTQISLQLSKNLNIPFIIFAHARDIFVDPDINELKKRVNGAAKVLVPSKFNKQYLIELLGLDNINNKINVLRNGIDLSYFDGCLNERHNTMVINILTVGRLVEKKGINDVIDTFALVYKQYNNIFLTIIGDGPLKQQYIKKINQSTIRNHVRLLGECSHERVLEEMRNSDIFFLPSYSASDNDREGLPVAISEASAMKLPILSTLHTGIPEGVIDNVTGFLVPERNIAEMANKLEKLIKDKELRAWMGNMGREFIKKYFNQETEVFLLNKIIKECIINS